jgi:hypothetical protein
MSKNPHRALPDEKLAELARALLVECNREGSTPITLGAAKRYLGRALKRTESWEDSPLLKAMDYSGKSFTDLLELTRPHNEYLTRITLARIVDLFVNFSSVTPLEYDTLRLFLGIHNTTDALFEVAQRPLDSKQDRLDSWDGELTHA